MFMKEPLEGEVKTRLAQETSEKFAVSLYQCFLEDLLNVLTPFSFVLYSNSSAEYNHHKVQVQQGEDLGKKMAHAFFMEFEKGYDNIVLIGSDSPQINGTLLQEALDSLSHKKCVIGPALDGGYYLIGFNKAGFDASLFDGITWSTPSVLTQTLQKIHKDKVYLLKELNDVDTVEDMKQLYDEYKEDLAMTQSISFMKEYYENL